MNSRRDSSAVGITYYLLIMQYFIVIITHTANKNDH